MMCVWGHFNSHSFAHACLEIACQKWEVWFILGSLALGEESDAMVKIMKNLPKKTVDQMKLSEYLWEIQEMRWLIEAFIPD
jgi:hypothetical protein